MDRPKTPSPDPVQQPGLSNDKVGPEKLVYTAPSYQAVSTDASILGREVLGQPPSLKRQPARSSKRHIRASTPIRTRCNDILSRDQGDPRLTDLARSGQSVEEWAYSNVRQRPIEHGTDMVEVFSSSLREAGRVLTPSPQHPFKSVDLDGWLSSVKRSSSCGSSAGSKRSERPTQTDDEESGRDGLWGKKKPRLADTAED